MRSSVLALASTEWDSQAGKSSSMPAVTRTTTSSVFSAVNAVTGGRMTPVCGRGSWKSIVSAPPGVAR